MMLKLTNGYLPSSTTLLLAFAAYVSYATVWGVLRWLSRPKFDAPLMVYPKTGEKLPPFADQHYLLKQNFEAYKDKFYKIRQTHGELIVLPLKYVNELRNLPEDKISFRQESEDRWCGSIVGMATNPYDASYPTTTQSLRHDMTKHLNSMLPEICDETEHAFSTLIGPCEEWTEVNVAEFTAKLVALVSGRFFVGPELNRDPRYLDALINYTVVTFISAIIANMVPFFLRRFAARFLIPQMRVVRRSQREMEQIMAPVVRERRKAMAEKRAPENMTTWNLRNSRPQDQADPRFQSNLQLAISMAAVHTTAMATSHSIFDLAARPEYVDALRDEVAAAAAVSEAGFLDKRSLPKLAQLDSFVKESQRLNPLGLLTFVRKIMSDVVLHDGAVLPKGAYIGVPTFAHSLDPARFQDPLAFDGLRFEKLRARPGMANRLHFADTGLGEHDMLSFGYGSHACPGRFVAAAEIKTSMAYLLQNYDVKMPDGQGRPDNIFTPGGSSPDPKQTVMFRRRR